MSETVWGIFPLAMDESDLMMLLLSLIILIVLIVLIFITFPFELALLMSAGIGLAFVYAVYETRKMARVNAGE